MRKYLIFILLVLFVFFLGGKVVSADELKIYHIVTTAGSDASKEITINWHASSSGSYVLLTESSDKEFNDAIKYFPSSEKYWSTKDYPGATQSDSFTEARYVCYLELKDLSPRTKYIYKIVLEDSESSVYSFMTAGLTNEWGFLAFCDLQSHYNTVSHPLINKLKNLFNKPPLVICSGDLIDTAAFENEWTHIFDDSNKTFSDFIFMSAPGDHEYWGNDVSPITMMKEPVTFNNILKNPDNGASMSKNTSYYFYYNNVLFVSLDMLDSNTASSTKLDEEVTWFKETLKKLEGTYQYLVVFEHKSIYGSTQEDSSVSKKIRPQWYPVFDEFGVDLVVSGHDHMHSRTFRLYNNMVSDDPLKGTYYLDLGSSGNKRRTLDNTTTTDGLHEKVIDIKELGISLGAYINVNDKRMIVSCYNQNGELVDSFTIISKRNPIDIPPTLFNEEEFLDNIEIVPNDVENKTALLNIKDCNSLKYVKIIEISSKKKNLSLDFYYTDYEDNYVLTEVSSNTFKISVTLIDGSNHEMTKDLTFSGGFSDLELNSVGNYQLEFHNDIKTFSNLNYEIIIDKESRALTKEELEAEIINLDYILLLKDFDIELVAKYNDKVIARSEINANKVCDNYIVLNKDILDIEIGTKALLIGYFGTLKEVDDGIIKLDTNGLLEVVSDGESVIEVNDSGVVTKYILKTLVTEEPVTQPEPTGEEEPIIDDEEPTPIEEPIVDPIITPVPSKKGCNSQTIIHLLSLLMIFGFVFILRKKYI